MNVRSVIPKAGTQVKTHVKGFFQFVREQKIAAFAIAFIIGGAVSKVVASFVTDLIQPLIGMLFGSTGGLKALHYKSLMYGNFLAVLIDFFIIAGIVYVVFKKLRLERWDMKQEEKKEYEKKEDERG